MNKTFAKPFIESIEFVLGNDAVYESEYKKIFRLRDFYNQPFDIGMLVNPIEKPKEDGIYTHGFNSPTDYPYQLKRWQEAEDKVLFEGWAMEPPSEIDFVNKQDKLEWRIIDFSRSGERNFVYQKNFDAKNSPTFRWSFPVPTTLNDFITDCCRASMRNSWRDWVVEKYFK